MQQPRRRTSYPPPPPMSYPRPLYHRYEARHPHAPRHYRVPPPPQASPGWVTATSHAPRELVGLPYPDYPREGEWVLSLEQLYLQSPSRRDGLSDAQERERRHDGAALIDRMARRLDL
ncbi:hypothetical protein Naga_100932g1 [Nannochloropsis gaditana]|uniref:Uncharacterized protein n=1 Tax=Nannochloropsis gaditana TaxID=72520 RepID=W7T2R9_9STRA|nr:hypothetical protein Naga_100932g1 [Nannochloropsis gaditana]